MSYPQFIKEREHHARKPHRCDFCEEQIDPGARYRRVSGLWDDRFESYAFHLRCHNAYLALQKEADAWDPIPFVEGREALTQRTLSRREIRAKEHPEHYECWGCDGTRVRWGVECKICAEVMA